MVFWELNKFTVKFKLFRVEKTVHLFNGSYHTLLDFYQRQDNDSIADLGVLDQTRITDRKRLRLDENRFKELSLRLANVQTIFEVAGGLGGLLN
jgi:Ran GTPase-activating protein (RanGAP) involved in mRNA processing and transport